VTIQWTDRAQDDLAAIHAFIETNSPHYAPVVVRRLLQRLSAFKTFRSLAGRVAEYNDPDVREIVLRPYRIVYRLVSANEIHVLTVHHGARGPLSPA